MSISFRPAVRQGIKLRVLLMGLSGAGKTYTALSLASHLGGSVAVVDTESGSASKYAGEKCQCHGCCGQGAAFAFNVCELERHGPDQFMEAMKAAEGHDVLILDSISHEWEACLELVDTANQKNRNKFTSWGPVTAKHNAFLEAIREWPGHVIATCRAKEKFATEGGKVNSQGILPVQRVGIEYEFDIGVFLSGARAQVVKTRAAALNDRVDARPGKDLAHAMLEWANGAEPAPPVDRDAANQEEVAADPPQDKNRDQVEREDVRARSQSTAPPPGQFADDEQSELVGKIRSAAGDANLGPQKVEPWIEAGIREGRLPDVLRHVRGLASRAPTASAFPVAE